jgi:pimeloyl-ACP methyl ester carboxylesterase
MNTSKSSVSYQPPTPVTLGSNGRTDSIQTVYDVFGKAADPPLVLIAGLGAQMIWWDAEFCALLARQGFRVIRFDNRDAGLATSFADSGVPDVFKLVEARLSGKIPDVSLPYTIDDMVDDVIALFDFLELAQVHVVGASWGGVIAQRLAIRFPDRVKTLTAIMTTTGAPDLPSSTPEAMAVFLHAPFNSREEYIEKSVISWRMFNGSGYEFDEEEARERAGRQYDRAYLPDGAARQLAAGLALEPLKPFLARLSAPTLVIHGDEDPVFPIECGRDIAVSVPNAKMLVMEGVGHALPKAIWPEIIDAISTHAQ